jgi:hypothetical protein
MPCTILTAVHVRPDGPTKNPYGATDDAVKKTTESLPSVPPVIHTTTTVNTEDAAINVRHQVLPGVPIAKDLANNTAKITEPGGATWLLLAQGNAKLKMVMKMSDPELAVSFLRPP